MRTVTMRAVTMRTTTLTRRAVAALGIALAAGALTACGGGDARDGAPDSNAAVEAPAPTETPAPTSAPATASRPSTATERPTASATAMIPPSTTEPAPTTATPAVHDGPLRAVALVPELVVLDAPDGSPVATVADRTAFGTATVLGVATPPAGDGWVSVLVPTRPNGLQGWVSETDVRVEPLTAEIFVDLTARTLRLVDDDVEVGTWPVAIGRPDRPTPTGDYFITDKLATGDPDSVWGAHAFGISAFSDVLTDFIGGIGQIGIHGTNNPDSIGQAASSGCIRLPNEVIDALIERLPLGTPVHIA